MLSDDSHRAQAQSRYLELQVAKGLAKHAFDQPFFVKKPQSSLQYLADVFNDVGIDLTLLLRMLPDLGTDIESRVSSVPRAQILLNSILATIPGGTFPLESVDYHPENPKPWSFIFGAPIDGTGIYHDIYSDVPTAEIVAVTKNERILYAQLGRVPQRLPTITFRRQTLMSEDKAGNVKWQDNRTAPLLTLPKGYTINRCNAPSCTPPYRFHDIVPAHPFINVTSKPSPLTPPLIPTR